MREKLDDEVLTETKTRYLLPENCDSLTTTKVNHLIWDQLKPETRSFDVKLQKVQAHIVKGVTPIVNIIQALLQAKDKIPTDALNVTFHGKTYVNTFAKRYEISLGIRSLPLKRFSISFTEFSVR